MSNPSRSFRLVWLGLTGAFWLLLLWLGTHKSQSADIFHRYSWRYFLFLATVFCVTVLVSTSRKKMYERRWTLILCLASLFVALGSVETYLRMADPLGISYFEESSRYQRDRIADPDLVFRHRQSWKSTYQGVEVRFNEFGLRDDPIHLKVRSEYRVLALGDSVTFGWGVSQEKTFPARLQQILSKKLTRPGRVINAGVGGYNTVQEYTFLKKVGLGFEPDLILLTYHPNDIETNEGPYDPWTALSLKDKTPPQTLELLLGKSWLYRLTSYTWRYGWFGFNTTPQSHVNELKGSQGWRESMEALQRISDLCDNHKIPLVVVYFRMRATPLNDALFNEVRKSMAPILVEDTIKWFGNTDPQSYVNSRIDPHLNAEGHQITAEKIADYLVNHLSHPLASHLSRQERPHAGQATLSKEASRSRFSG